MKDVIYKSDANEKYKWMYKHPIKTFENTFGIKFNWYQKFLLLIHHHRGKRKKKNFEKIVGKYMK